MRGGSGGERVSAAVWPARSGAQSPPMASDEDLRRDSGRFTRIGLKLLLGALALAVVGGIIAVVGVSVAAWLKALGIMLAWIAIAPAVAGVALILIGGTAGWAGRRRPFA